MFTIAQPRMVGEDGIAILPSAPVRTRSRDVEYTRAKAAMNVLTNAEVVIHACLARRASARYLLFERSDYPAMDPPAWRKFVTVRLRDGRVVEGERPLDYYGPLEESYESHNGDYIRDNA